ncbi:hypothetical protein IWW35_000072 [Coemansia sp. RSA 1878]|nr:hypothetical protein IWW35_000072 [Coemansia sp. RSA 1878]
MKCVYRIACLAVLGSVMATPDVTGTKTVLISLATGEHGEIIPFVLTSNSNGLVPVELSTVASVEPVGWVDTDVQGVAPSANSMDSVKEGDLELEESSDYVMLAESTDIESQVESAEVESAETESADVESAETESAEDVSAEEAVPAEENISPEDAPIQDTTLGEASNIDDQAEYDSDSDSDDTASKPSQSSAHTPTTLLTLSLCIIALTF